MIAFPNAKINLGLNILSRRPDGYHNLSSCFIPIDWCDVLEIVESDQFQFQSTGIPIPGDENTNLVIKAYHLLKGNYDLPPVSIHLHKVIPMGAGLGGGSSDAAFTLKILNDLFDLKLPVTELEKYATQLGADCPFFIENKAKLVGGIGEVFESVNLSLEGYQLQVVFPGIHVNTGQAFQSITPEDPTHWPKDVVIKPVDSWKDKLVNDFEKPVFAAHPELEEIKEKMYGEGAIYAAMSGSGSSIFSIWEHDAEPVSFPYPSFTHQF
ncbi:4-(cytidine 5'-diphospho)-2-C-methyl-D-erythritol kinase [Reichenbachiella ulvae]|uniref:4-diphosphocytidyl-2-C-methyl-D-erythritol kinase n=1 Tax=Reichenbachiella ulvae TaxID=2980104 RepID=A0ABT3D0V9_9BACT|nr:4-(cytidine 5'-diphospho)-2-C-methyl-D-erythritol kinase [Reichenbachiella ulvae]MCV9389459.1 4-(cytidine 5'-diphospho)-2-C-methyl-D-erythritol kinase [Reichenbachiella ulvae]